MPTNWTTIGEVLSRSLHSGIQNVTIMHRFHTHHNSHVHSLPLLNDLEVLDLVCQRGDLQDLSSVHIGFTARVSYDGDTPDDAITLDYIEDAVHAKLPALHARGILSVGPVVSYELAPVTILNSHNIGIPM